MKPTKILIAVTYLLLTQNTYSAELAKVNDAVITTESFQAALKALGPQGDMVAAQPELRKKFLDHMINSLVIAKKARAESFDKDPKYQARLADVATQLLAGEYMDRYIEKNLSDKSIQKWFDQNKILFSKKEIHAKHILCDTEENAKKAHQEVNKDLTKFDETAKKYSKDKTTDLGFFPRGRMIREFEEAAFAAKPNSLIPKPVKTQFGWHVIYVLEVRGDDGVKFEDVKPEVTKKYRQKLQEDLVHDLRDKTKISINDSLLKDSKTK